MFRNSQKNCIKLWLIKKWLKNLKQCENVINEFAYFNFYTFDEFCNNVCLNDENKINIFKNYYSCNNNNTITLLRNVDDDEYIIINFEHDIIVHTQNDDIEYVENVDYHNALYDILKTLFCCEYVQH